MAESVTTAALIDVLGAAIPVLNDEDRRLVRTVVRLLGEGEPLPLSRVADALGRPEREVAAIMAELPGVYYDEGGRVVGFWGLAVVEMPHPLRGDARELFAWCAEDTLFLPLVLETKAGVESTCPQTRTPITLTVSHEGVSDVSPRGAVMSFRAPGEEGFRGDVIQ